MTLSLIVLSRSIFTNLKNFFMGRCPKDEPTGKNLVCKKKAFPISEKNWKNLLGGGWHPPPGHRRVNEGIRYCVFLHLITLDHVIDYDGMQCDTRLVPVGRLDFVEALTAVIFCEIHLHNQ